jgi:hypothetical protein
VTWQATTLSKPSTRELPSATALPVPYLRRETTQQHPARYAGAALYKMGIMRFVLVPLIALIVGQR